MRTDWRWVGVLVAGMGLGCSMDVDLSQPCGPGCGGCCAYGLCHVGDDDDYCGSGGDWCGVCGEGLRCDDGICQAPICTPLRCERADLLCCPPGASWGVWNEAQDLCVCGGG